MRKRCLLILALPLLLGCVVGAGLRALSLSEPDLEPAPEVSGISPVPERLPASPSHAAKPEPEKEIENQDIWESHGEDSFTLLLTKIEKASSAELDDLLRTLDTHERIDILTKDLVFLRWTEIDPERALSVAQELGMLHSAYWAWAKVDREAALSYTQEAGDPQWLGCVVRAIGQDDPEAGMALIETILPVGKRSSAWNGTLSALGHVEPQRALEYALKSNVWPSEVVQEWIRKDPMTAFTWMNEHLPPNEEHKWKRAFEAILRSHPDKAVTVLEKLPEGRQRISLMADYVSFLSVNDLEKAEAFLEQAPPAIQDYARVQMAERLMGLDPERAYQVLEEIHWAEPTPNAGAVGAVYPRGSSRRGQNWAVVDTVSAMAKADPSRTAAFLETLPTSALTIKAYDELVEHWMKEDSMATSRWIAQIDSGPTRDTAIVTMTNKLTRRSGKQPADFEAAVSWLLQISDGAEKDRHLQNVFSQWRDRDPASVEAGLEIPGVPEAIREQFTPTLILP